MILEEICNRYDGVEFMMIPDFGNCVVGVETDSMCLIYSTKKIINRLSKNMSESDAWEYMEFHMRLNTDIENAPIFMDDDF